jgi:hypothetical protein
MQRHAATAPLTQGLYYLATGLWPLASIRSFQRVTGPKTDLWLVKTVGALIAVEGGALTVAARRHRFTPEMALLAIGSALGLAAVDVAYALRGRISPIYLLDAVAELALALGVGGAMRRRRTMR